MRVNPAAVAFVLLGALLSFALGTPIPFYCFVGFMLFVTMATLASEEHKRRGM